MIFCGVLPTAWLLVGTVALSAEPATLPGLTYPPAIPGARVETYKKVGDLPLHVYLYFPEHHAPSDRRAAIVFFFGGGWRAGSPQQFVPQCEYLAARGMVAMVADYRVHSRHQTQAVACVADGKSAIRWVRSNADRLGIDLERIVAAGGSAGGHVAACTGLIDGFEEPGETTTVRSRPNAMVLLNPVLQLAAVDGIDPWPAERMERLADRLGTTPRNLSPHHHIAPGAPPTLILHGTDDAAVPYRTAEQFTQAMRHAGNRCELRGFAGQGHGFFNRRRDDDRGYRETIKAIDEFLVSLDYLHEPP
ncbi:MAG: hypothetical protein A2W31_16930 [Planctomycetes bacterium RBG_16_64_10]|nr:MAG: hypothetical protein A2W31_16930 [Planctomycetes bacterium RBG_16_64_10]